MTWQPGWYLHIVTEVVGMALNLSHEPPVLRVGQHLIVTDADEGRLQSGLRVAGLRFRAKVGAVAGRIDDLGTSGWWVDRSSSLVLRAEHAESLLTALHHLGPDARIVSASAPQVETPELAGLGTSNSAVVGHELRRSDSWSARAASSP